MKYYVLMKWYLDSNIPHVTLAGEREIIQQFQNALDAHSLKVLQLRDMHIYDVSKPGVMQKVYTLASPP